MLFYGVGNHGGGLTESIEYPSPYQTEMAEQD